MSAWGLHRCFVLQPFRVFWVKVEIMDVDGICALPFYVILIFTESVEDFGWEGGDKTSQPCLTQVFFIVTKLRPYRLV